MTRQPILALSTLLISSLIIPITISISLRPAIPLGSEPNCWDPGASFEPLVFRDCLEIINSQIARGRDPTIPLTFSRFSSLQPDIKLPRYWTARDGVKRNKCVVSIDFANDDVQYDRTTLNDIKRRAMELARECVIKEPHLGGVVQFGWRSMLGVMLTRYRGPLGGNGTGVVESER